MHRIINKKIHLIVIYVDDLLLMTDPTEAKQLKKALVAEFT